MSDIKFEKRCMMCGRNEEEAGPLNRFPGGFMICQDCVNRAMDNFQKSGMTIADLMNMSKNLPSPDDIEKLTNMAEKMGFGQMSFGVPGTWAKKREDASDVTKTGVAEDPVKDSFSTMENESANASQNSANANPDTVNTADDAKASADTKNSAATDTDNAETVEASEKVTGEVEDTKKKVKIPSDVEFSGTIPIGGGNLNEILDSIVDAITGMGGEDEEEDADEADSSEADGDKKSDKGKKKKKHVSMMFMNPFGGLGGEQDKYSVKKKTEEEKEKERQEFDIRTIPAPHQVKQQLDEYVIGQTRAKKAIAVAVYNHYKRIYSDPSDGVEIEKSNMMLIGPTGSGKTYLVKTLARLLDVPLAIADATSLTEAGYVGDDIESVISKLLKAADNDVDRAERGIVFIDEIDKLAKKRNMHSRDVSGESVQQELLKMLEGAQIDVPIGGSNKNMMVPTTTIDTNNILFICGGAFPELEGVITDRLTKNNSIGFGAEMLDAEHMSAGEKLSKVTTEDLRTFGMIPEFLGRLPVIVTLDSLTEDFLVEILTEPKNAIIKQYKKLFAMDEVKLEFEEEALRIVARRALERETGARALRAVLEEFMQDIMYEIPKDPNIGEVVITADYLEKKGGPIIKFRGQE